MEPRPPAAGSTLSESAPHPASWSLGGPPSRRRRIVVDRKYQLRVSALAASVTLILLLLLNLSLFFFDPAPGTGAGLDRNAARASIVGTDRTQFGLLLAGSVVFLAGVFVVGIAESHRTSGAALAIRRGIEAFRLGDLGARVRLRRGDHLQELGAAFNAMADEAAAAAAGEADALDLLAARAEESGAREVAVELRLRADAKRGSRR